MQKTRIEWVKNSDGTQGYSWNPIKGICPVGCWYCYGKRIYERFKLYPNKRFSLLECAEPLHLRKPSKIFVCSTFELFHPIITDRQRTLIFRVIKNCPQHTFQILTKFPQNIDRPMPDNVWLGVSLDGIDLLEDVKKSWALRDAKAKVKFHSFEPLIDPPYLKHVYVFDWIIIGRLTGYGKKFNPKKRWIEEIVDEHKSCGVPIFLKNNLKEIWGKPLIQEFPCVA